MSATMQARRLGPCQPSTSAPATCARPLRLARRPLRVAASQAQMPPPPQRPQAPPGQGRTDPQGTWAPPPPGQQWGGGPPGGPPPLPPNDSGGINSYTKAIIAAAFMLGLGLGVYYDSEVTLSPQNVSSTQLIDRAGPNADVCMAYGYSASVFDMSLYVSFNPFNVYVTQPVVKPGCVLRRANIGILEREKLVDTKTIDACKNRMNTFAYTGDLKDSPDVQCVYHSEESENLYLEALKSKR